MRYFPPVVTLHFVLIKSWCRLICVSRFWNSEETVASLGSSPSHMPLENFRHPEKSFKGVEAVEGAALHAPLSRSRVFALKRCLYLVRCAVESSSLGE